VIATGQYTEKDWNVLLDDVTVSSTTDFVKIQLKTQLSLISVATW